MSVTFTFEIAFNYLFTDDNHSELIQNGIAFLHDNRLAALACFDKALASENRPNCCHTCLTAWLLKEARFMKH
jgi:hypothetical protein